jgi:hypothetical protein
MMSDAPFLQRQPQRLQRFTNSVSVYLAIGENRVELVLPQSQPVLAHNVAGKRFHLAALVGLDPRTERIPLGLGGP